MRVRATQQGFYMGRHIDPGTIFDVKSELFSDANKKFGWMEKVIESEMALPTPVEQIPEIPRKPGWFQK